MSNEMPSDVIWQRSRDVIYDWHSARTAPIQQLSRMLAQTSQEYADRFLVELVQNGYDANDPATTTGRVHVVLDETEGENGTITVANTGRPFTKSNFVALASLGLSDKGPGEGIGNKGLGFKSVFQVSDSPQVFSQSLFGSTPSYFEGYCFGFANDANFESLVPDPVERARAKDEISRYLLPVPLEVTVQQEGIARCAQEGFATAIRLPLKSMGALATARDRLQMLADSTTPLLLFLDRLEAVTIVHKTESGELKTRMTRQAKPSSVMPDIDAFEVNLGECGNFLVFSQEVDHETVRDALTRSIDAGHIDERWQNWKTDARVAVALRMEDVPTKGRYYTYLPLGEVSVAPCAAHVHAPFFVSLARTGVNLNIDFNAALLDGVANLCAQVALSLAETETFAGLRASTDLVTWSDQLERLVAAFDGIGVPLAGAPVVAALPRPSGIRAPLDRSRHWKWDTTKVLTAIWLSEVLDIATIDDRLGSERIVKLDKLVSELTGANLTPKDEELGEWAELRAAALLKDPWNHEMWMEFYDDVAFVWAGRSEKLVGKRLILDDSRKLQLAGGRRAQPSAKQGPALFFFPQRGVHGEEQVDDALDIQLPNQLRRYIAFTQHELTWYEGARATRAREFFSQLVRRYTTTDVLDEIEELLAREPSDSVFDAALKLVARLEGKVGSDKARLDGRNLRVPTDSGWIDARIVHFAPAWGTPAARLLDECIQAGGPTTPELAELSKRMLLPPEKWLPQNADIGKWTNFLVRIGVKDGLQPEPASRSNLRMIGQSWRPDHIAVRLNLNGAQCEAFVSMSPRPNGFQDYPHTEYVNLQPFWRLPGQAEFTHMTGRVRRQYAQLVLRMLSTNGTAQLTAPVRRVNHIQDQVTFWPTPLAAFAYSESWLPVRRSGDEEFVQPNEAWYFDDDGHTPVWAPVVSPDFARLIDPRALEALESLGLRRWRDSRNAPELLAEMSQLVDLGQVGSNPGRAFLRTCEDAWRDLASESPEREVSRMPPRAVVRSGDRVRSIDLNAAESSLYVDDGSNPQHIRALLAAGAAVLVARHEDGQRIASLLRQNAAADVRTLNSVQLEILVDGLPFIPNSEDVTAVHVVGEWLIPLVQTALEFRTSSFTRHYPESLRAASDAVRTLRVRPAHSMSVVVDGRPLPKSDRSDDAILVAIDDMPTVILPNVSLRDPWRVAENISRPIAELVRAPELGSVLFQAIVRIERMDSGLTTDSIGPSDIASSLDLNRADVEDAVALVRVALDEVALRYALAIHAVHGHDSAELVGSAQRASSTEAEFLRMIGDLGLKKQHWLEAVQNAPDYRTLRDLLALPFADFNEALICFGFASLADPDAQRMRFDDFLHLQRRAIGDLMRAAFLSTFRAAGDLRQYVSLQALPGLEPDPSWIETVEIPTEDQMWERVTEWLTEHNVQECDEPFGLVPVEDLRAENTRLIREFVTDGTPRVRAWCQTHTAIPHTCWSPTGSQPMVDWASGRGILDFERLETLRIIDELIANSMWPSGMPRTLDLSSLGLNGDQITEERDRETREHLEHQRDRITFDIDGQRFGSDPEDLVRLMDAIRSSIGSDFTERSGEAALGAPPSEYQRSRSAGRSPIRITGRSEGLTPEQSTIIGFAGEVLAYEWLLGEFPTSEVYWASGYRDYVFGGTEGSDVLGYDFRVATPTRTMYFEVKSTSGDALQFEMSPGEEDFARSLRRRSDLSVLFVRNAQQPSAATVLSLPNPFSRSGTDHYRRSGSLRLSFRLAEES
jgi:hypothetical protein